MNSVTPFNLRHSHAVDTARTADATQKVNVPLCHFVAENQSGLRHAAHLLGGSVAARNFDAIAESLSNATITRSTRSRLRALLGLLTLEHVHDMDRIEAGLFSQIDPSDPIVDEICLLADGLRSALHEMHELEDALIPIQSQGK